MRLFIAIDVSDEISDYCKELQKLIKGSLTRSFHITLKFLGEVNNPDEITEKLSNIKFEEFTLKTTDIGYFPNERFIRVIWLGIENSDALLKLQESIETSLKEFKSDHKFHPHITLARVNQKIKFTDFFSCDLLAIGNFGGCEHSFHVFPLSSDLKMVGPKCPVFVASKILFLFLGSGTM